MKTGKLSDEKLKKLVLDRLAPCSEDVLEGPGTGLDCGIIKSKGDVLVISSDPITGAAKNIGILAIHVSCNDIACCGITPKGINLVMIVPESTTVEEIKTIVDQVSKEAKSLNVDIVGGHTEVSSAVNRPILTTTAFGFASEKQIIYSSGAKVGDSIIMTKRAALEGTAILAADFKDRLLEIMSEDEIHKGESLINQISVVPEGVLCGESGVVNAMHDATEGGILGAVGELAIASKKGFIVDLRKIPVLNVTKQICEFFKINPYRLISSGSMIISTSNPDKIKKILSSNNIESEIIGKIQEKGYEYLTLDGKLMEMDFTGPDELYKIKY